ncbi:hypothetical protein [Mariniphaga anaerophila]|nr:hypothetical protein [Mariniphaga anaerophila]
MQFENLLREKALSYKPDISPNVYTRIYEGINAGTKTAIANSGKTAALEISIARTAHWTTLKTVIGIVLATALGLSVYFFMKFDESAIPKTNELTEQERINHTPKDPIENKSGLSEHSVNTDEVNPVLKTPLQKQVNKNGELPRGNKKQEKMMQITTGEKKQKHVNITDSFLPIKTEIHQLNLKPLPEKEYQLDIGSPFKIVPVPRITNASVKGKSHSRVKQKGKPHENGFSIASKSMVGLPFLLKNKESLNGLAEKSQGTSWSSNIAILYQLNDQWKVGIKTGYQQINLKSKYYSSNSLDGVIQRDILLLSIKAGLQYQIFSRGNWNVDLISNVGLSYKLRHTNGFSGKYFEQAFSIDQKKQNTWSPTADMELNLNYKIGTHFSLGAGIYTDFIYFEKESQLLDAGGQIILTYFW